MSSLSLSSTAFDADASLRYVDTPRRRRLLQATALTALAIYAVYLGYRGRYTLNPDAWAFSLAVYAAEIHGFCSLAFYYFQTWALRRREVPVLETPPGVDVFITTYDEDVDLLRQTVRAAIAMRVPHRTFVLDDGRRADVQALCTELGCDYVTRATNEHAKAGNWNHAFAQTSGTLIATFDADHVPRADFLERTLGFFADPKVALVQVPQRYHNLDSLQHRVSWRTRRLYGEQDVFFNLVMPGKDHWNATFFCGTGAVLRREALTPFGGLVTGSITEDMHTSLELQAAGWKTVYLNELLVTGLAPMDFASYSSQRLRWAEGNLKIIRVSNPFTMRGLSLAQRVCYLASMFHWTTGLAKLVFYLAPPIMLFTGQFPIAHFDRAFVLVYLAHLVSLVGSYKLLSRGTGRLFMDELFNMANFFTLLVAFRRFAFGRGAGRFVVTSKRGGDRREGALLPQYTLMAFTVLAFVWSGLGLGFGVTEDIVGASVAAFWAGYNLVLMAGVVGLALRPPQRRAAVRFRAAVPVAIDGEARALGVTLNLSEGGCTLLWPHGLAAGATVRLRLHIGNRIVECPARVLRQAERRASGWVAHGIQFDGAIDLTDRVADALYNMAVPELFARLTQPSFGRRLWRSLTIRARHGVHVRAARHEAFLPVVVDSPYGEFVATTRDLSASGLSILSPRRLAPGTTLALTVTSGAESWTCTATVSRSVECPAPRPEFTAWQLGLRLEPAEAASLRHALTAEVA